MDAVLQSRRIDILGNAGAVEPNLSCQLNDLTIPQPLRQAAEHGRRLRYSVFIKEARAIPRPHRTR